MELQNNPQKGNHPFITPETVASCSMPRKGHVIHTRCLGISGGPIGLLIQKQIHLSSLISQVMIGQSIIICFTYPCSHTWVTLCSTKGRRGSMRFVVMPAANGQANN